MSRRILGFIGGVPIQKKTYPHLYDELFQASLRAVKQLDWKLISQDRTAGKIEAETGGSLRSWGENISIHLSEEATGTTISVFSGPSFQLFDWGKSEENEKAFHKELKKIIPR